MKTQPLRRVELLRGDRTLAFWREGYDRRTYITYQVFTDKGKGLSQKKNYTESRRPLQDPETVKKIYGDVKKWLPGLSELDFEQFLAEYSEEIEALPEHVIKEPEVKPSDVPSEALSILKDPKLFDRVMEELNKIIVGELDSRKVIFLCSGGRLVENPESPVSYHLLLNSTSGAGKDYVVSHVLELLPKEFVIMRRRMTANYLDYFANEHPGFRWDSKVLFAIDASDVFINSDSFKTFLSDSGEVGIVQDQRAVDLPDLGRPVVIMSVAHLKTGDEMLRRFVLLSLDESEAQTGKIHEEQAGWAESGAKPELDSKLREALGCLKRVKVKIPFARRIVRHFPTSHVKLRSTFGRFTDYIKASAALHQFSRERDKEGFIIATEADYNLAREVLLKTASNSALKALTLEDKRIIKIAREMAKERGTDGFFYLDDYAERIDFCCEDWTRDRLNYLTGEGFFKKTKRYPRDEEGQKRGNRKADLWKLIDFTDFKLPTFKELEEEKEQGDLVGEYKGEVSAGEFMAQVRRLFGFKKGTDLLPEADLIKFISEELTVPKNEVENTLRHCLNKGDLNDPKKGMIALVAK